MGEPTISAGQATSSTILSRMPLTPDTVIQMAGGDDNAPFYRLYSMLKYEDTANSKARWYEDDDFAATVTVSTAAASNATTVIIPDYSIIVKGQTLYNKRTGEIMRVSATPTTSSVTVVRAFGTTAGAAINAGDVLVRMSVAAEEGSSPVDTYTSEPWLEYNVVQMKRYGWKVTGLAAKEQVWGVGKESYDREKAARDFMRQIQQSFLFGQYYYGSISTAIHRQSGGLEYFMHKDGSRSLNFDVTGEIFSEALFNNIMVQYFARASAGGNKIMLCGTNVFAAMSSWAREKQMIVNDGMTAALGTTISSYLCSTGQKITLMPYEPWTHDGVRGLGMKDRAWIIDLDRMWRVGVPGRPTNVELVTTGTADGNLAGFGVDAIFKELWVEDGLKVKNTENFADISGIAA